MQEALGEWYFLLSAIDKDKDKVRVKDCDGRKEQKKGEALGAKNGGGVMSKGRGRREKRKTRERSTPLETSF